MKILSLYVENFGTLHQFSLTPEDGKNTLLRPNGWGKSSLAVFIKAMLYGLPASTRRSLIENERKRYTPWQGGTFGGSMDVELSERRVRVERTFGAKESEDTLSLTDLDSGVELPIDHTVTLGEAWFGVDAAAYERSTYISQRPMDESDGNLSIHAKLNRLADATDDIAGYDHAMELLEKQRKYYAVSGGRRGAIADDEEALARLETQMEDCRAHMVAAKAEEARLERLLSDLQACKEDGASLLAKEQELLRRGEQQAKVQVLRRMVAQYDQTEAEMTGLMRSLGGRLPTEQTIETLRLLEQEITATASLEQQVSLRCAPTQPLANELGELAALLGDAIPDEAGLNQLREVAESAKAAHWQLQAQTSKDASPKGEKGGEELPSFPDARRLRHFLAQYPVQKAQADKRTAELERGYREGLKRVEQLQDSCKKRKAALLIALAAALVVSGVLSIFQPIAGFAVLVLGFAVTGVCLSRWRKAEAHCGDEQAELQELIAQRDAHRQEAAQLQEQWLGACVRIREVLGVAVSDAEAALSAMDAYEAKRARAEAHQREREATREQWRAQLSALQEQAEREGARLCQLWVWGEIPSPENAPIAVERLAQRAARYAQLRQEWADAEQQRRQLGEKLQELQQQREAQLAGCEQPPQSGVAGWLQERGEQIRRLQKSCEQQRAEIVAYAQENDLSAQQLSQQDEQPPLDGERLRQAREELEAREQGLHGEIARCRREIEMHGAAGVMLESLETDAEEIRTRLEQQRAALQTILSAQKYLKEAKEQFSGRYLERMKASFRRYLSRLCGEESLSVTMDGNFSVKLRRAGVSRSPEAMSTGWRDMIALCARLSLVDALFEEETPFLVLDDPFVNLDDEVAARAADILDEAASRYQILYLTCHSSRA